MTFEIDIGGRTRSVVIERAGDTAGVYRISVDGRAQQVDVRRIDEFSLSLLVERGTARRSRDVQIAQGTVRGELLVTLDGRTVAATVNGRRTGRAAAGGAAHAPGEQAIVAPMPGRVVRVLVNAGDEVEARQGVVVVEAMKMENELRSPKAGRVKDVHVTVGASVEAGRVLIVIE